MASSLRDRSEFEIAPHGEGDAVCRKGPGRRRGAVSPCPALRADAAKRSVLGGSIRWRVAQVGMAKALSVRFAQARR